MSVSKVRVDVIESDDGVVEILVQNQQQAGPRTLSPDLSAKYRIKDRCRGDPTFGQQVEKPLSTY